jgi:hypothetical protein
MWAAVFVIVGEETSAEPARRLSSLHGRRRYPLKDPTEQAGTPPSAPLAAGRARIERENEE